MSKLTPKQARFTEEYLIDLNATQAAIRAGYSPATAKEQGCQLLTKLNIQAAIAHEQAERSCRTGVSQDRVIREYARLAFFDPRKLFDDNGKPKDVSELDDDTAAALVGLDVYEEYEGAGDSRTLAGYTKKYKLANKLGALDSLGKHLGMFDSCSKDAAEMQSDPDPLTKSIYEVTKNGVIPEAEADIDIPTDEIHSADL